MIPKYHRIIDPLPNVTAGPDARRASYMERLFVASVVFCAPILAAGACSSVAKGNCTHALTGEASYYADSLAGKKTASGDKYDPKVKTCAHQTLPFGTRLRIEHQENKKTTECEVTDRGPYGDDRVLDLSRAAAQEIDMIKAGKADVVATVLDGPAECK